MIEIYEQLKKEGFFSVSTKFKPPPEYLPSRSSDSISFTNNSKQKNEKNSKKEVLYSSILKRDDLFILDYLLFQSFLI